MEYVYAALVLHSAGKEITEEGIKAILESAGIEVNEARVKALVSALEDVNIDEAIEKASFAPVSAPAAPSAVETTVEKKEEEEEEEEEEEKKEEEAIEGLGALFG